MARSRFRQLWAGTALVALGSVPLSVALAADVQAGKTVSQAKCSQCHEADDWEGESAASLESLIRDIVAGKVKHKAPLQLTPAEVADIAAYWGQSSQKGRKRR
ncbi:hypothetical protein [Steroidobacter sp.]|uniref:hypothetical protein n=1 Tax=Steroidobacter sp. TaxID=1978227 RepID=UPI001A545259|nr:hypothetical protein [Steroidobacter sp.]MBL8270347.1 hypothetical protein [Steroidobacter sp.]